MTTMDWLGLIQIAIVLTGIVAGLAHSLKEMHR